MSRLPPLSRLAGSSAGVRGAELSPSPVAAERGRDRPAAPPAEGWGVGGRGKEGGGLPGAERAAVQREQEPPPPSLPRLLGECGSPGSPAVLGGGGRHGRERRGTAVGGGGARPPLRIPGAPREGQAGQGRPPRRPLPGRGSASAPRAPGPAPGWPRRVGAVRAVTAGRERGGGMLGSGGAPGLGEEGVRVTLIIALCWPAACVICDQLFISCTTYGAEGQR